jgi:hypothetical protein
MKQTNSLILESSRQQSTSRVMRGALSGIVRIQIQSLLNGGHVLQDKTGFLMKWHEL